MSTVGERERRTQERVVAAFRGVREGRLKEVTKEHPHDITVALHGLVENGLLVSKGSDRGTRSDGCLLPAP